MRVMVLVLALASAFALAADNAMIAPQPTTSHKPQTTSYGAEAITIPQMLSYQGKLTDTLGQPVPNGNYQLTFRLYTQPTGGSAVWTEAQTIPVKNGLFAALLGVLTPITSLPESGACYLSLQVAANPELSPRQRIVSAAYSYLAARAANADLLQGKDTTALDARYVNEGQASSVTSNMIVDGAIAAADLGQMGASSGQVMKWTGSAWAPRNDSVGQSSGGTVTSVGQATGVVCSPNPIITTGTVRFDSTWGDARFVNENQSAGGDLTGTYPNPTIHLPYSGSVATGSSAFSVTNTQTTNDAAAIIGTHAVTDYYGIGVKAVGGFEGLNASVTPTGSMSYYGVMGNVSGGSGTNYGVDGYAQGTGTNYGVYGSAAGGSANYAGYFNGDVRVNGQCHGVSAASGSHAIFGEGGTYACGVYGTSTTASYTGVQGDGGTVTDGIYASANNSGRLGLRAYNANASGTALLANGCGQSGGYPADGCGLAANGKRYAVYGYASDTGSGTGGYFSNGHGNAVRVSYYSNGTEYKILGSGTVSTIMATREGKKNLFAPEMPEPYFEDCGEGQLANGHCRVNLEKLFSDCITVNAEHPLRVFVQLMDDCNGVYVKRDAAGFDVYELHGGKSNAQFSWRVLARWKGNENLRLPEAPGPLPAVTAEKPATVEVKTTTVTQPQPVEVKSATATQPRPVPGLK